MAVRKFTADLRRVITRFIYINILNCRIFRIFIYGEFSISGPGNNRNPTSVTNKTAIVTGANKGVGFQIAKAPADNGYTVYVASRNLKNGECAVAEIKSKSRAIQLDVTDPILFVKLSPLLPLPPFYQQEHKRL